MKKVFICLLVLGILIAFHPNETRAQEDPIEKLKNAAKADPKDYAPHFGLGQAYHRMGIYDKAITEYKKSHRAGTSFRRSLQWTRFQLWRTGSV